MNVAVLSSTPGGASDKPQEMVASKLAYLIVRSAALLLREPRRMGDVSMIGEVKFIYLW
jgi:hypothetical protein